MQAIFMRPYVVVLRCLVTFAGCNKRGRPVESDPSQIPVQPIAFEHGLTHFANGLDRRQVRIVAIGSSTTAGEGGIAPYPQRLLSALRGQYPDVTIEVINRGVGGEEAPAELKRFDYDVFDHNP